MDGSTIIQSEQMKPFKDILLKQNPINHNLFLSLRLIQRITIRLSEIQICQKLL